jgi:hypothetical protein
VGGEDGSSSTLPYASELIPRPSVSLTPVPESETLPAPTALPALVAVTPRLAVSLPALAGVKAIVTLTLSLAAS